MSLWRRGLLIAISGVDGSGKTTQAELLAERLRRNGADTKMVWCRWRPILSLPLLALFLRLGYARVHATSSIGFVETTISRKRGLASVWSFLVAVDNMLKNGLLVLIPLVSGRTVICDRYVLDMLVEAMADLHDLPGNLRLGQKMLRLLPRPDQAFLVNTDPIVAYTRKPDLPSLSHFKERTELYQELATMLGVQAVDGGSSPEAIHAMIWERVSRATKF